MRVFYNYLKILGGAFLCLMLFSACGKENSFSDSSDVFYEEIENISSSSIGRLEPIVISFKEKIKHTDKLEKAVYLKPKQAGSFQFSDEQTCIFTPSKPYKAEEEITLVVDVGLLKNGKAGTIGFEKTFTVQPPWVSLTFEDVKPGKEDGFFELAGILQTDIPIEEDIAKKMISFEQDGKQKINEIEIELTRKEELEASVYGILIKNIKREKEEKAFTVILDGKPIDSSDSKNFNFAIPGEGVFEASSFNVDSGSEITVFFSGFLDKNQNLNEFITAWSEKQLYYRTEISGNKIKLYTNSGSWHSDCKFEIKKGLRNSKGLVSKKDFSFAIKEFWEKPEISFASGGNILPAKDKAEVLIKTKNVRGMYMEAFNIYGKNMLQFLQDNNLDGHYNLVRVGEPVWSGSFEFDWEKEMKNRDIIRAVDISGLVKKFPTGMFELKITFSKKDSMYEAPNAAEDFSHMEFPKNEQETYYDGQYSDDYSWREFWEQRNNPCHPAFYSLEFNDSIIQTKNILVSNIGLAAKKDNNGNLYVAVTDLITAQPLSGARVSVFTYAQREMFSGTADSKGLIVFEKAHKAAFIQCEKNGQSSWINLNTAPLSASHFPVDGEHSKDGVKGFIYGERGVWRPGDNIHLVFILQDEDKTLPKDFPVEFTLSDPKGRQTEQCILDSSVDGFYRIDTATAKDGVTGSWTASVKIGGNTWTKKLKVESIVPNRLFVELKPEKPYLSQGKNSILFSGEWLHGAKASGLKGEISCRYFVNSNPFPEYKNYIFINENTFYESDTETVWTGDLDEDGKAKISLNLNQGKDGDVPGKLKAVFESRVYELSGAFSVEHKTFDYSPYSRYVGFKFPEGSDDYREGMLYTDRDHYADIIVLTPDGKLFPKKTSVYVSMYKLEWRWWWESEAYTDAAYNSDRSAKLVAESAAEVINGRASWKFNIKDKDWGRYLLVVKDENGHSTSGVVYVDTAYWSNRSSGDTNGGAVMLMLTAGKDKYFTGDTAEITFPASENSAALITVEKNGKVLSQDWIQTKQGTNSYKIRLSKEMTPNIYVHVSLLQEYKQTKNSLPIRLYGIIPIMIENKNTRLVPKISAEEKFESGGKAKFTVREENGKPMTFTVAVVDEGLLGLTAFKTANPWNSFYKKEASSLLSWDIFGSVIGAFGGRIETMLAVGGGGYVERKGSKEAERFKPVVLFFGPYSIDSKSKKEIEFDMPQYTGAVRIMVTAGKNGAYGTEEKTVKVGSDLIVLPSLPRTLGIGEEIEVPVTVFNGTASKNNITVTLNAAGAAKINETKKVIVNSNSNETVIFKVKPHTAGKAVFTAKASGSGTSKKAESITEIQVFSRGTPYVKTQTETLGRGESKNIQISMPGEIGTKKLSVEVSQMPTLGLDSRLSFLLEYPHGCIEQITSKAFPQLYVSNFVEMDETAVQKTKDNISSVLERYSSYQTSSGGFAYWPGDSYESLWGSCYAGHFMTEAKKAGYSIKNSLYDSWLERQIQLAKEWSPGYMNDPAIQAYRLYVLASAGKPDMGAMNRLKNVIGNSDIEVCLLANAYAFAGNKSSALSLIKDIAADLGKHKKVNYKTFGSGIRDAAMILQTYTLLQDKVKAAKLVPKLAEICRKTDYLSTQETAWLLISLAPHYNYDKTKRIKCIITCKEKKLNAELGSTSKIFDIGIDDSNVQNLKIENAGEVPFYVSVKGESRLAAGEEKDYAGGLIMYAEYFDEYGNGINLDDIKLGDRFIISVQVENNTPYSVENIALTLPIPTGWEISNKRLADDTEENADDFDYQDIRDSYIYTYFALSAEEVKTFQFDATAVYGGTYYLPAITAEAMYDKDYKVLRKGKIITVSKK